MAPAPVFLDRIVRWTPWSGAGLEHLNIVVFDGGVNIHSLVIGHSEGVPLGVSFHLILYPDWGFRSLYLGVVRGDSHHVVLHRKDGRWRDMAASKDLPQFDDCIDIDLSITPFTNTLPIRRLGLKPGESREIRAVHLAPPDFSPRPAKQRYTRLADRRYLYEDATFGFTAELEVDEDGLVLDYPGLFRRVPD